MRKRKAEKQKKEVRIDHRTVILVSKDIPDNVAIARFKEKRKFYESASGRKGNFKKKNDNLLLDKDD
jgi:hypothetical protein